MLPHQTLTAVVSDREITLDAIGRTTVLVFHGQDTAGEAMTVNASVRAAYPDPDEILIASIIDLRQFPSMFHGMVKPEIEKAYHKAAGSLAPGADAGALIILLPDWKGEAHEACGVHDSTREAAIIVADNEGRVLHRAQGEPLGTAALAALRNR